MEHEARFVNIENTLSNHGQRISSAEKTQDGMGATLKEFEKSLITLTVTMEKDMQGQRMQSAEHFKTIMAHLTKQDTQSELQQQIIEKFMSASLVDSSPDGFAELRKNSEYTTGKRKDGADLARTIKTTIAKWGTGIILSLIGLGVAAYIQNVKTERNFDAIKTGEVISGD